MSTASGHRHVWLPRLLLAPLLFAAPAVGSSHTGMNASETGRPGVVPGNSDAGRYGSAWECSRGFEKLAEACVAIKVPANADPHSFRRDGGRCAAVTVPADGFLQRAGDDRDCDRDSRKHAEVCVPVEVPANAHLDWSGNSWECERGFRQQDSICVPLVVPASAYLGYSGHPMSKLSWPRIR